MKHGCNSKVRIWVAFGLALIFATNLAEAKSTNSGQPQISDAEMESQEERSIWAHYRMGTAARHKGNAQEATRAYETIIKKGVGQEAEKTHKIISYMYLAEIASEMLKDKQLAMESLQKVILTVDAIDMDKIRDDEATGWAVLKGWASYEYERLKDGKALLPDSSKFSKAEMASCFMPAMMIAELSLSGTGLTLEQIAQNTKSPIDSAIAKLVLAFGYMPHSNNTPEAEKHLSSLAKSDSYLAVYADRLLELLRKEKERPRRVERKVSADEIAKLVEDLKYPDRAVHEDAMRRLANYCGIEGVEALVQAQKNPDKNIRYRAAFALSRTRYTSYKPDFKIVLEAITNEDRKTLFHAFSALKYGNRPVMGQKELSALVMLLKDDVTLGSNIESVFEALGPKASKAAVPVMIEVLHYENKYVRQHICRMLGEMGPAAEEAFPELAKYLEHKDGNIRDAAANALNSIDSQRAVTLIKAIKERKAKAKEEKVRALVPEIPWAIEKLQVTRDIEQHRQAIELLIAVRHKAVPYIFEALKNNNISVSRALSILSEIKWSKEDLAGVPTKEVALAFIEAAKDPDYTISQNSKEALCKLNSTDAICVYIDILSEEINLSNADLKAQAAGALEAIGPAAKAAAPALKKIAEADRGYAGRAARDALRSICRDKLLVPRFIEKLKSPDMETRRRAIASLQMIRSPEARRAIPNLIEILENETENEMCRIEAAQTLAHLKAEDAVPVLVEIFMGEKTGPGEFMLRREAARALGLMGPVAKPAIPTLMAVVEDESENVGYRCSAAKALGQLKFADAVPVLTRILRQRGELRRIGEDSHMRGAAANALGLMGDKAMPAISVLVATLKDGSETPGVRSGAAEALGRLKYEPAVPALIKMLEEKDLRWGKHMASDLRKSVVRALGYMGPQGKTAVPTLIETLKDDEAYIRKCAADALGSMGPQAKAAGPALKEALEDDDRNVRRSAADALKKIEGN